MTVVKIKASEMKTILSMVFIAALMSVIMTGCDEESEPLLPQDNDDTSLPDIQYFKTNPSDRFIVDIPTITAGHPFRGRRANQPHQGAHTHWDNSQNTWPQGGTSPQNYPAIYAVADGYIDRIDYSLQVGQNDRYGVDLAFARNNSSVFLLCYAIEPMVPEPSDGFYRPFINVTLGQHVEKGDTIAFMYLPENAGIGCHIHFHIMKTHENNFFAPAIFRKDVVDSFYSRWGSFGNDGPTPLPSCMGYMLDADENPYGDGPVDVLLKAGRP
jgi:hypothetical protein